MAKFFTALIFAIWIVAIALLSVQNATPVSLRFLAFQTVQIPVGLVLALSAALGMVGMAVALPMLRLGGR
jgi:uncharacterized integral membrane protein